MGGEEVVHGHGTDLLEDLLLAGLLETELFGDQVGIEHGLAGDALGAELAEDGGLRNLQILRGLRDILDDQVEGFDGLAQLVVLRVDGGIEGVGVARILRIGQAGAGAVGQGAGFAHLLEDDGIHPAAEVLVEQRDGGVILHGELFAPAGVLHIIELT